MLVDRDYELSLVNIQVSQMNSEKHAAAAKEYKPQVQTRQSEDKTGLNQLLEAARDKIQQFDPLAEVQTAMKLGQNRVKSKEIMTQWRIWFYFDKIIDVRRSLLKTGTQPLFLHVKLADQNTYKMQLSDKKGNIELCKERILSYVKVPNQNLIIVGQTQDIRQLGISKSQAIDTQKRKKSKSEVDQQGVVKILRVKQSKFAYLFASNQQYGDMIEFLRTVPLELRLTVGHSWDNFFFSCKGPLLRKLSATDYKHRGCEDNFSRNVLMFNQNMEHVNLRVSFGACRDFDSDISLVKDLQQIQLGNISIKVAPTDYYSPTMALNSLPMRWFNQIIGSEAIINPAKLKVSTAGPDIRKRSDQNSP